MNSSEGTECIVINVILQSQNSLGWKGVKVHPAPTTAMGRAAPHQLRLPRAPSNLALSASRNCS